jgi:hypothetical protein
MGNLSRHTDLLCELGTSLLMRGIQIGEMSKLGWLIGLTKHAIWADSLYVLYLQLLSSIHLNEICALLSCTNSAARRTAVQKMYLCLSFEIKQKLYLNTMNQLILMSSRLCPGGLVRGYTCTWGPPGAIFRVHTKWYGVTAHKIAI